MKIIINDLDELEELASKLAKITFKNMIICLDGDLGSGKTTFTKLYAKQINITEVVTSPTFTIIKEYKSGKIPLYHMDVYRLLGSEDEIGLEDYFEKDGVVFIEWSHIIEDILPEDRLNIIIKTLNESKREIKIEAHGDKYKMIMEALK